MNEDDAKRQLMRIIRTCQCCNKEFKNSFDVKILRGMDDMKLVRACKECADEYFEQVKSEYFVEEYKGNKFYKYKDKYYPYWGATYCFDSIEECRNRAN